METKDEISGDSRSELTNHSEPRPPPNLNY